MATKYNSKKVVVDNIKFDSIVESRYYQQLKWLQENKQILFFRLQPRYLLQEAFEKDGQKFKKIDYLGDFEIHHLDGSIEVVDIKGAPPTEAFKIKRKLFEKRYPHKLSIITYSEMDGGWLEYSKLEQLRKERKKKREEMEINAKQTETKTEVKKNNRTKAKGSA